MLINKFEMKNGIYILLAFIFLLGASGNVDAKNRKKEQKETKKEVETPYDKLFKGKKYTTVDGLMKVHYIDQKVYVEFPLTLLEKDMMLASSIENISDNGEGVVGQFAGYPFRMRFTLQDSMLQARAVLFDLPVNTGKEVKVNRALAEASLPGIYASFEVKAYTPDSTAVVVDMTKLFLESSYYTNPFASYAGNSLFGFVAREHKFRKERSSIVGIKAYDDNITVLCNLGYNVDHKVFGAFMMKKDVPVTATINKMLRLLPADPMMPRLADSRIGIAHVERTDYSGGSEGFKPVYYTKRWRLEPADEVKYRNGELVEPKKPIVFYLDTLMPEFWKPYVKKGVEAWNEAFEKIGFKNVVSVRDFPANDPNFNANNVNYNTIRYAPLWLYFIQNSIQIDPRTGEILNASMYIHDNVVAGLHEDRLMNTMASDPSVRTLKPTPELDGEALRLKVMQIAGKCLGLEENMGATYAYPTDSLRSASFTKVHGLSPSIMDYFMFNYIAQPEDVAKGARLTTTGLGVYDFYAIKWLYTPIPDAKTPRDEAATLDKWIREHQDDPVYRFGIRQPSYASYDPTSMYADLGNDPVKGLKYAINNIKASIQNVYTWYDGSEDRNMAKRKGMYNSLVSALRSKLEYAYALIGGMYLADKREGDTQPSYLPVDKARQREVMKYMVELSRDLSWLDNESALKEFEIGDKAAAKNETEIIYGLLDRIRYIAIAAERGGEYSPQEYINDIYNIIWEPTIKNRKLTMNDMKLQSNFLASIIATSSVTLPAAVFEVPREAFRLTDFQAQCARNIQCRDYSLIENAAFPVTFGEEGLVLAQERKGFGEMPFIEAKPYPTTHLFYSMLLKTRDMLNTAVSRNTGEAKAYYELLLFKVQKALDNKK
jgi:hypothetical protein